MLKEKIRIFPLARELDMESKDLVALCRQNGIDVKSQLSTIEPEVRDAIVALVRKQGVNKAAAISPPTLPSIKTKHKAAAPTPPVRQPPPSVSETASRLERLRSLGRSLKLTSLERVIEQHAEDLLKSMRKAAETAVRRAAKSAQKTPFFDAIRALEGKISEKSHCLLHHVRGMGNVAVHSDGACFTPEEVNYLTRALAVALEEMIAKKLL
jgi:hypothetical protein